jgi:hypothetical protein
VNLRDELTALAEGARSYADPDAAVRTVRRRQTVGLVAAPLLVLVAVAALLILPGWRLGGPGAPKDRLVGTDLTAVGAAPVLPVDRAVGPAALAYTTQGRTWLVTRDGHRYELPPATSEGGATSLSPDGRWLVLNGRLRDLTSRTLHIMQGQRVLAWSPNAAWILVEDSLQQQFLVKAATGRVSAVLSHPGRAVLDDGSVVVSEGDTGSGAPGPPNVVTLGVLDPRTGPLLRTVVVDARSALSGGEAVKDRQGLIRMWFGPDDQALFEVAGGQPPGHCALLTSVRAPQRVTAIPAEAGGQEWLPLGFIDDAVLIKSAADQAPVELRAWRDGGSTPLFRLPPGSAVLAPGGATAS